MVTTQRHKVFVSYHHYYDEEYKKVFCDVLVTLQKTLGL